MEAFKDYPLISQYFEENWIEKELKNGNPSKHPIIYQFQIDDEDANFFLDCVESSLKTVERELSSIKKYKKRLKLEFWPTFAEIEVGSFFKNIGFKIKFQPKIDKNKSSDLLLQYQDELINVEITRKNEPETKILKDYGSMKITTLPTVSPANYADKINNKRDQLSNIYSNIICLHLHPSLVSNYRNRQLALYDGILYHNENAGYIVSGYSALQFDKISAILEFSNYGRSRLHILLHLNPKSQNPLKENIIEKFRSEGIEIAEEPLILPK